MNFKSDFYTHFEMEWDYILLSHYRNGKKYNEKIKLKPYHFIPAYGDSAKYEDIKGNKMARVDFESVREARDFVKQYDEVGNYKVLGSPLYHYHFIHQHYKDIKFDHRLVKVMNFDIETDTDGGYPNIPLADKHITTISCKLFGSNDIYVMGYGDYEPQEKELVEKIESGEIRVHYKKCKNERELLTRFIQIWEYLEPDVVTGWNIQSFDIPYIIKRMKYTLNDKEYLRLSPFRTVKETVVTNQWGKEEDRFNIVGVPTLDYIEIYKKFTMGNEEEYSLNYISEKVLGLTKLDYSEYGNLNDLYKGNFNKYVDYNIIDIIRVEQIDLRTRYINIAYEIAYETKATYTDCFGTIRVWDTMIHNYLIDRNIVVPLRSDAVKDRSIAGGFVKQPYLGKHKYVMSFDFKSLYPHLAMSFNISPDTYIGAVPDLVGPDSMMKILDGKADKLYNLLREKNVCITGCGTIFSREKQGFIPAIMERLFSIRSEHSKQEDHFQKLNAATPKAEYAEQQTVFANKSQAIKILLNSGYGALSNQYYRFFHLLTAESFTLSGQLSVLTVEKFVNLRLNEYLGTEDEDYIVAIDTDSIYINLERLVEEHLPEGENHVDFLERFSDTIQGWIQEGLEHLYDQTNVFEPKLYMALEVIGSAIWTAKKRYVMAVPSFKKIRFDPPMIKIQGLEAVRSSTPKILREWITEVVPIALMQSDRDMRNYLDKRWNDFKSLSPFIYAKPSSINDIESWYVRDDEEFRKGTPYHVKGALVFNRFLAEHGIEDRYDKIKSGDKIKMIYLKTPNPMFNKLISLPENGEVHIERIRDHIDIEQHFDKLFLDPIKRLTGAAGISLSNNISIDEFAV